MPPATPFHPSVDICLDCEREVVENEAMINGRKVLACVYVGGI